MPSPRYSDLNSTCQRETSGWRMASSGFVVKKGHPSFGVGAVFTLKDYQGRLNLFYMSVKKHSLQVRTTDECSAALTVFVSWRFTEEVEKSE
eukprot:2773482-Karenia_brevis.AAC.1